MSGEPAAAAIRAHLLLELAGHRRIEREVAGVVRRGASS